MNIQSFTFNPFQENTYILYDNTKECIVIDPGCYTKEEEEILENFISSNNLKPVRLINTHAHIDHTFGNYFVAKKFNLEVELHPLDLPILEGAKRWAETYGLNFTESPEPQLTLKEGEQISFGETVLEIIHLPGHSPGHVVLLNKKTNKMIGGDVLFRQSIGRTDLPGGNHHDLIESIRQKLFTLEEEIEVFPGHGPTTTIGYEKENNPFF